MELDQVIEQYHSALHSFARGDPEPVKALYSHQEDVTLANPFGPPVRGRADVADRLEYAASRFRDGRPVGFQNLALIVGSDLASLLEVERWETKVGERDEITPFVLRTPASSDWRTPRGCWCTDTPTRSPQSIRMAHWRGNSAIGSAARRHRGSGFGPVAVTSRCGTQSSTWLKPSKRPSSSSTTSKKERR